MTDSTLLGARAVRRLLSRHHASPRKELGQNFVIDPNTIRKVVAAAEVDAGDRILEVGAGVGSLTLGLANEAANVVAIEFDERLVEALGETTSSLDNVTVVRGDALKMDLGKFQADKFVGNLPYNIATSLVLQTLEQAPHIDHLVVMTQKEVGLRLAASPGSKAYGHVSVMVRFYGTAKVVAEISRRAFYPVPRVDSVLVKISRSKQESEIDRQKLFAVVRTAFGQRRKTLRNSLSGLAGSPDFVVRACESAGIDPGARPETISLEGFVALARAMEQP